MIPLPHFFFGDHPTGIAHAPIGYWRPAQGARSPVRNRSAPGGGAEIRLGTPGFPLRGDGRASLDGPSKVRVPKSPSEARRTGTEKGEGRPGRSGLNAVAGRATRNACSSHSQRGSPGPFPTPQYFEPSANLPRPGLLCVHNRESRSALLFGSGGTPMTPPSLEPRSMARSPQPVS